MRRKGGMFGCAAAYGNSMKKSFLSLILLCGLMPVLSACGGGDDTAYLSEARSDLFCAQTEDFTLTARPGTLYRDHLERLHQHPARIVDGRFAGGYFALTPVLPDSQYRACIEFDAR